MSQALSTAFSSPSNRHRVQFHDQLTEDGGEQSLLEALTIGLTDSPRWISPKHFYDHRGSELFDRICQQPEYYPTRTEESILEQSVDAIADRVGGDIDLIELGSGASHKIRLLLDALRPHHYVGVDISRDFLLESTRRLADDYPWLAVHALCADFTAPFTLPELEGDARPVVFFPGSSIGNFTPREAGELLTRVHDQLPPGGGLLIGVDRIKGRDRLEAAYNDAAGVTREFNLNLIHRLRDELGAGVSPEDFEHLAFYNEAASRIEMHLISQRDQSFSLDDQIITLAAGEHIHTENSWKYSREGFEKLAGHAGFTRRDHWCDDAQLFDVHYFERPA
ncbi:L-histidine N(alpha)-methyltransferase [Kushneria indalinina]|uniref:Dimethylhistidine N-methyltransferase n=1 Tax=Kushneria indalinina DSM 14324 TaxID=1122140 RepID=A0A3D9DSE3_9GAMM|nr:L-histidine N(alpha)-methyltransferase [Kushneria indalinina]REC93575.1 dimethylhistidine N-methyltransferase [Kushneria indalinina DSM 14324]